VVLVRSVNYLYVKYGEDPLDYIVDAIKDLWPPSVVIIEEANGDKGNVPAYYGGIWEGAIRAIYVELINDGRLRSTLRCQESVVGISH